MNISLSTIQKILAALNEKERSELGIGNLKGDSERGGCEDCGGPLKFESGWGYSCSNACYKLGNLLRSMKTR